VITINNFRIIEIPPNVGMAENLMLKKNVILNETTAKWRT